MLTASQNFHPNANDAEDSLRHRIEELRRVAAHSHRMQEKGPLVVEDDLAWLDGSRGPAAIGVAQTARKQMEAGMEMGSSLKLVHAGLRSSAQKREQKLKELISELEQLKKDATNTPQERHADAAGARAVRNLSAHVSAMEFKALQAGDYTATLQLLLDRLHSSQHEPAEAVATIKAQACVRKPRTLAAAHD